jgi:hypothetical protein
MKIGPFALLALLITSCAGPLESVADTGGQELGAVEERRLNEISGVAASRQNEGVLWVHDDGDIEEIYALTTAGAPVTRLNLAESITDCEDIAIGPGPSGAGDYLYLGDIGDNDEDRESIRIYRLPEPVISPTTPGKIAASEVELLSLTYPDGRHDAEALLVDSLSGDVLVVTKEKNRARLYAVPASSWGKAPSVQLQFLASLAVETVSAGAISRDGLQILLRREEEGWHWRREEGQSVATAVRASPRIVPVLGQTQRDNGEAIDFHPEGRAYYTVSEGKRQPIYLFPIPKE